MVLKEKLRQVETVKSLLKQNPAANQAGPNRKWLGAFHRQKLGGDFSREKAEAKRGNHWPAIAESVGGCL